MEKNILTLDEMSADESEKRESVSVNLTPAAKRMVEAWRDETGIPKTEALERLLQWYFAQPEDVQSKILARKYNPAPAAQLDGMDLAGLSELMRAVAARFDAFMDAERKRPASALDSRLRLAGKSPGKSRPKSDD